MACKHFEGAQNGKLNNGRNFNDNAERAVQLECLSYLQNNNNIAFCFERLQNNRLIKRNLRCEIMWQSPIFLKKQ